MTYRQVSVTPAEFIEKNFLHPLYGDDLKEAAEGLKILRSMKIAEREGCLAQPGVVYSRVKHVEDLGNGHELDIRIATPENSYNIRKKVKGAWVYHLHPDTRKYTAATEYRVLLCENVERLPNDFMLFDGKSHGLEHMSAGSENLPLGPDSHLVLMVTDNDMRFLQFSATAPEWEDQIIDYLSRPVAVRQSYGFDMWQLNGVWSRGAMVTMGRNFSLYLKRPEKNGK
ncbi:MAG: hypothetical protein HYT71_00025 [Candidatus Aenigmarchaeota archaeon]|nr:hypothetical protein [Candidatus Aenigmarchaeota archaeon]